MKSLRLIPETILLYLMFGIFSVLPPVTASNLGGFLARSLGPHLGVTRRARANIKNAMPEKSETEVQSIIIEMWDNLGRVFAEYPHLEYIARERTISRNTHIVDRALADGNGGIFFGGHLGNWEVNGAAMLTHKNIAMRLTYRAANNPLADKLLEYARTMNGKLIAIPKARSSAKDLMKSMKEKNFIGILLDQKYNEGLPSVFFGQPAMSNPVAVVLAQKYNAPLIPAQNIRTGPAQFEIILHKPLALFHADGTALPQEQIVQQTQDILEGWNSSAPGPMDLASPALNSIKLIDGLVCR